MSAAGRVARVLFGGGLSRRLVAVVVVWSLYLFWCESVAFHAAIAPCTFGSTNIADGDDALRIAMIADPQLTDRYSYKQSGVKLALVQFFCDAYMKKAFGLIMLYRSPDAVVFLGDLLDGGREVDDVTYAHRQETGQ